MTPRPAVAAALLALLGLAACGGATPSVTSPAPSDSSTSGTPSHVSSKESAAPKPVAPTRLVVRTEPWRLPFALAREAVVRRPGGRYVVAGGLLPGDLSSARTFVLDPRSGRTRETAPLPVAVHDTAGVRLDGRALVLGGGNASEQAVVQRQDGGRWAVDARLPQARSDLSAVTVGSQALVLGGYDGTGTAVPDVLASTDGGRWSVVGRLPLPVRYAASTVTGHTVWLFGGERDGAMVDAVQRVDASGHATVVAHLPVPVGHAVAVRLGSRILVAGGRLSADVLTDRAWWFDPTTRRFTRAGRLPTPLADAAVAARGDRVAYLVGGETPSESDRVLRLSLR